MRDGADLERPSQVSVSIKPGFRKDCVQENPKKLSYEQRLSLISTATWVRAPEFLLLNSGGTLFINYIHRPGRDFSVRVDPTKLSSGLHYAEVQAFDSAHPEKGPIFRVPVTVTKPHDPQNSSVTYTLSHGPGHIERQFVRVPAGATWAGMLDLIQRI